MEILDSLKKYIKNNLFAITSSSILFLLIYITWLANNPIHFDTFLYEAQPGTHYDSAQIGRWGLCVFKYLINGWIFNKFLEKVLGYTAIIIAMIVFGFSGFYFTKKNEKIWPWFGLLIVSSPVVCNFLYFEMQLIGSGMGFLLCALSVLFNLYFLKNKKIVYLIFGIIFGTVAFGCYQAFINIYISFVLLIFILKYLNEKWNIKDVIILIGQFILMYILNLIVGKFMGATESYGYNTINWATIPFDQSINSVIRSCGKILIVPPDCFSIVFSVIVVITILLSTIFLIYKITKREFSYIFIWICIGLFELSTFFIIIIKGGGGLIPPRGLLVYVFVFVGNIFIIYNILSSFNMKIVRYCTLAILVSAVLFVNVSVTEKMLYNDFVRNEKDLQVLNEINIDLHKFANKPVAFIGYTQPSLNGLVTESYDTIDTSILNEKNLNQVSDNVLHTGHIVQVFNASSINTKLSAATSSQINQAQDLAEIMSSYPNAGYIQDHGDYIIVKLGE